MARVLYVSQYFVSGDEPGGVRHWQHCRALAREGHDVTVVTSYVQHKGRTIPEEYRGKRIVTSEEDGLRVVRTYATPGYGGDRRSRMSNYATFTLWSALAEMRVPRPDVVVASSPQLPAAAAAAGVAQARRSRFLLEVRDLMPESAVVMGMFTNPRIIKALTRMEHYCYRRADRIVALTEGIRQGVIGSGVVPAGKVSLITNGIDLDVLPASPEPARLPVPDDAFVAMFVGAHGAYSSLETVVEAAGLLRDDPSIRVVLVGTGDRKEALQQQTREMGLANVVFDGPVPKREVPAYLGRADLCLLPYRDHPLFTGALPNKVFDYMAAGRPILAAAPAGELTGMIERAGCGWSVPPQDPAAMAAAIRAAAADRAASAARGAAGREYALEHFDRARLAARFVALVDELAAGAR